MAVPSRSGFPAGSSASDFSPRVVENGRSSDGSVRQAKLGAGPVRPSYRRWLVRLLRRIEPAPQPPLERERSAVAADPLLAFVSETGAEETTGAADGIGQAKPGAEQGRTWRTPTWLVTAAAAGIIALAGGLLFSPIRARLMPVHAEPRAGKVTIETRPGGAEVSVDGQRRGDTPLTLSLSPGPHTITLRRGTEERAVPLTLASGAEVTEYLEFAPSVAAAVQGGRISVITDPPGASVKVDGVPRGISPTTVVDLSPANHVVMVTNATGSAQRTLPVESGGTTSVVFSLPKLSAPLGGWLTVAAPFELQVVEHDKLVGTSGTERIMLPAGRHDVELVNQSLEYRVSRAIEVVPGKVATIRIDPPNGMLSANARPWADLWIDGTNVGQTPIANLSVPIGTHQVIFRHPQFGERRQTIVVTTKGPNRIAVDLSK
jgi:hypothetical protein